MVIIEDAKASTMLGIDKCYITFTVKDTREDLDNYKFTLTRSGFEDGDYENIIDYIDGFECIDDTVNLKNEDIVYFYKIMITNLINSSISYSDIFYINGRKSDTYSEYFNSIYSTYLDCGINNTEILYLRRKRQGTLCNCFDDIRKSSKKTKCTDCFQTNYTGGYNKPLKINICYLNSPAETERFEVSGVSGDKTPISAWTGNYPVIQPGDILIDSFDNTRYVVMSMQPSFKNKILIRQTIQIQRMPKTDVIYKLKIEGV
ncbi:MAG: hypothetical protein ACRCX2_34610 [Paraclostridium sp.]